MSCRHNLANGTCTRCYPDNPFKRSDADRVDPAPEVEYEPNLEGLSAVPHRQATHPKRFTFKLELNRGRKYRNPFVDVVVLVLRFGREHVFESTFEARESMLEEEFEFEVNRQYELAWAEVYTLAREYGYVP
jgi:hypothetical protein